VGYLTDNGSAWITQVRELETSDLVLGGPGGASNGPLQDLANRTAFLKAQVDGKAALVHLHAQSDVTGLVDALVGKAAATHTHAQLSDVAGLVDALAAKAPYTHTHAQGDITGLAAALASFAPLSHVHGIAQVTGLAAAIAGCAPLSHTHQISDVSGLSTALASYQQTATAINTGNIAAQSVAYANSAGAVPWYGVSSKPTTCGGYGITDAITTSNIGNQSVAYAAGAGKAAVLTGAALGSNLYGSTRQSGGVYTNTTGRMLWLYLFGTNSGGASNGSVFVYLNGENLGQINAYGQYWFSLIPIPPGYTYQFSASNCTITRWYEV
jgi:hypothetical protein